MSLGIRRSSGDDEVVLAITGEADSTSAPALNRALAEVVRDRPHRLVLDLVGLTYLSSAGLRCLVHAHQVLGRGVEIVVVGASDEVADTIRLTGFASGVTLRPSVVDGA